MAEEHAAGDARQEAPDPRFSSGLPEAWQLDDMEFLRLSGFTERRRVPAAKPVAASAAPTAVQAPPSSAKAFGAIIAELSEAAESDHQADNADADYPSDADALIPARRDQAQAGPEDEPLAAWHESEAGQYEAQRRLRDANVRLAEAEQLLRALDSQPRDRRQDDDDLPEAGVARRSVRRFFLAFLLLVFVVGLVAAGSYLLWRYYPEVVSLFNLR